MTAEVRRLTGAGPVIVGHPEQDVVELLEELLEEAKRGEISGFGVSVVNGAGSISTNYAAGCAERHLMLAAAAMLFHRFQVSVAADQ